MISSSSLSSSSVSKTMISFSDETKAIDSDVGLFAASDEFPSEVLESIDVEVGFGDAEQGDTLRHSWSESCTTDTKTPTLPRPPEPVPETALEEEG